MSLPQEFPLQNSRESVFKDASEISNSFYKFEKPQSVISSNIAEYSQSGSLFSIHSAPPIPVANLGIFEGDKPIDENSKFYFTNGMQGSLKVDTNSQHHNNFSESGNVFQTDEPQKTEYDDIKNKAKDKPSCLKISSFPSLATKTTEKASEFYQNQILETEEDDNENLLTVSSITAKPLIAKSRELRSIYFVAKNDKSKENKKLKNTRSNLKENNENFNSSASETLEGGYGWLIVFGAFSVQFWVAGLVKSYGVLYVEIMETFPKTSASVASWIPAILSALCLALAPLSSALCQRFSCRIVVFIGGLFCAFGMTLSYFATDLLHLLFTFGILTGIGGGLSTTPGVVIVSQYFDKHRALANGITVSGTAAGSFILPVLIKHLVDSFGFHGTLLILGGCMLHVCFSATLYRPIEVNDKECVDVMENSEVTRSLTDLNITNAYQGLLTNSTYVNSTENLDDQNFIEQLFLNDKTKQKNNFYNSNKLVNTNDKTTSAIDVSDDEGKDTVGETTFTKPFKYGCSSTILHSVEDLSTDSTCVYRQRGGTESNRGSRRRKNTLNIDEILPRYNDKNEKDETVKKTLMINSSSKNLKGLSKSMELPTPSSFCTNYKQEDRDEYKNRCFNFVQEYLDITLLKDTTFILMCLSVTLMSVGCPYMLYYLPAHVISIGYSKSEGGYLVAVSASLDLIGRLGLGWLSDMQLFDRRKIYILCIIGAGISALLVPSIQSFYLMGLLLATYGFCLGCWYLLMPVLLADLFGTERISSSYGLVRMFQSIGAITVPPLAGFLRDISGDYKICFYVMGSCMVCGCLPLLVYAVMKHKENKKPTLDDECDVHSPVC